MSSSKSKPVLGYWRIRGMCQHTRLLLTYAGADFEDKTYEFGPAPNFHKESWLSDKFILGLEFPNLPYWIDDDVKITESKAILKYVAKTKAPALVPTTPQLQAVADMLDGVILDLHRSLIEYAYAPAGQTPTAPEISNAAKFEQLVAFIGKQNWVLGDKISYIDFYLAEVLTQYRLYKKDVLSKYPVLESYLQRFESLPQLKEYIKANAHLTAYSPHATIIF